ncbi:MAG: hypothetical protein WDO70_04260 [Alphaproteobacteria bacterium]
MSVTLRDQNEAFQGKALAPDAYSPVIVESVENLFKLAASQFKREEGFTIRPSGNAVNGITSFDVYHGKATLQVGKPFADSNEEFFAGWSAGRMPQRRQMSYLGIVGIMGDFMRNFTPK